MRSWTLRHCLHERLRFLLYRPAADWHDSPQATAAYMQWAWCNYHAKLLRVWAFILIIQIIQYRRDIKNTFQQVAVYAMIVLAAVVAVLTFCNASMTTATHWASRALITFSVLQAVTTIHIALDNGAPAKSLVHACSYWLDLITHIIIVVPCLALADFRGKEFLCLFLLHMLAGVPFHMKISSYGVPLAVLKALIQQAMPVLAYALLERTKYTTFMRLVSSQGVQCSKLAGVPVQPAAVVQEAVQEAVKLPSPGHARAPPVSDQDTAVEGIRPCKYVSPLRRVKAHVKLESSLNPQDLSEEAVKLLPEAAASCLEDCCLVSTAIRHGCIVLSIDVCELQQVAHQEQLAGSVSELTRQALLKWLERSGLEQQLQHGSTLVIQVEGHTWNCSWDGHAQAWSVEEDESQRSAFGLSVLDIALFLPAAPSPALPPSHVPPYAPLTFDVYITAPSAFHLKGWQEASEQQEAPVQEHSAPVQQSGASEQQPGAPEQPAGSLQLLAHTCGRFLPVTIQDVARVEEQEGRYCAQVCVSCHSDILTLECCQLRLELVRGDFLLSNVTMMLANTRLAEAVNELKAWAQPPSTPAQISEFVGDLSEWLSFDSLVHLSEEGKRVLINSAQAGVHPCMMPSLVAGAQRPGALSMMIEVGLDLLRHLVSCGMAALSERVLAGLLHAPLHTPFSTIAHGSPTAPPSLGTNDEARSILNAPSHPQSLLAYALMSNNEAMLARVLAWGHQYGEPGFSWSEAPPGRHTAADISMVRLLRSLPDASALQASHTAHSMLCHLLSDPLAKPVTQRVRAALPAPVSSPSSAGHIGTEEQAGASPWAASAGAQVSPQVSPPQLAAKEQLQTALEQHNSTKAQPKPSLTQRAIALGQKGLGEVVAEPHVASGSVPPSSSELQQCTSPKTAAQQPAEGCAVREGSRNSDSVRRNSSGGRDSAGLLSLEALGLVLGFGESGDVKESEYQNWLSDTSAGIVKACSTGVVMYFWYTAMKSAFEGLFQSAIIVAMYPVPMSLLLCTKQRRMRQASMLLASVFHVSYYLLFGLGMLPSIVARKLALTHLDLIVEVVIWRLFQQVPLKVLLFERAANTLGFALLYRKLSLPYPTIQAVAVNLASVLVGIILEMRNRRIYLRIQDNLKDIKPGANTRSVQSAKKDE